MKSVVALLLVLTLVSCGKNNQVASDVGTVITNPGTTIPTPSTTSGALSIFNNVIAQSPACSTGSRINIHMQNGGAANLTTLSNSFSLVSTPPSGTVADFYVGISQTKDVMVVSKLSSGTGYAVSVSFCPYGTTLVAGRTISQFSAPSGIVLSDSTTSTTGGLYSIGTYVYLEQQNFYSAIWFGPTTFYPAYLSNNTYTAVYN